MWPPEPGDPADAAAPRHPGRRPGRGLRARRGGRRASSSAATRTTTRSCGSTATPPATPSACSSALKFGGRSPPASLASDAVADLPALPEGLTARPLRADDVAAVAALLAAAEQVDDTGEYLDADDLTEWWTGWRADLARDGVAVCDAAGLVVGYATALASATFRDAFRVYLEGRVRPDQRGEGIGRALLDWQLERGRGGARRAPSGGAGPARGRRRPRRCRRWRGWCRRAGLTAERWYRDMERPLDRPARRAPAVAGRRAGAVHAGTGTTRCGARTTPPSPSTTAPASATPRPGRRCSPVSARSGPTCRCWRWRTAPSSATSLAYVYEADTRATGERQIHLGQIGVLPQARGRGLATAVIAAALRAGAAERLRGRRAWASTARTSPGRCGSTRALGFATVRSQRGLVSTLPPVAERRA